MRVKLSGEELLMAGQMGAYRLVSSMMDESKGEKYGHYYDIKSWGRQIESVAAEIALAKVLGLYWSGLQGREAQDVVGWDVRHTEYEGGHLLIHPGDTGPHALVTGMFGEYVVRGWMHAKEAKQERYYKELQAGRPAYCVPQKDLHEF